MTEITVIETAQDRIDMWAAQAFACYRDGRPDLVEICLEALRVAEYEGDRVIRWFEEEP